MSYKFSKFTENVIYSERVKYFWLWLFFIRPFIWIIVNFFDFCHNKTQKKFAKIKDEKGRLFYYFSFLFYAMAMCVIAMIFAKIWIFLAKIIYHSFLSDNILVILFTAFCWIFGAMLLGYMEYRLFFRKKFIQADKERKQICEKAQKKIDALFSVSEKELFESNFIDAGKEEYMRLESDFYRFIAFVDKNSWTYVGFKDLSWVNFNGNIPVLLFSLNEQKIIAELDFKYCYHALSKYAQRASKHNIEYLLNKIDKVIVNQLDFSFLNAIFQLAQNKEEHNFVFYLVLVEENDEYKFKVAGAEIDGQYFILYPFRTIKRAEKIIEDMNSALEEQEEKIERIWR